MSRRALWLCACAFLSVALLWGSLSVLRMTDALGLGHPQNEIPGWVWVALEAADGLLGFALVSLGAACLWFGLRRH